MDRTQDPNAALDPTATPATPEPDQPQGIVPAVPDAVTAPSGTPSEDTTPQFTADDFQRLQAQLGEKDTRLTEYESLIGQIKATAEQQRQAQQAQQFEQQARGGLEQVLTNFAHLESASDLAGQVYPYVENLVRSAITARDEQWQAEFQKFQNQTRPLQNEHTANQIITELGVPAELKATLTQFSDPQTQRAIAEAYRAAQAATARTEQAQRDAAITRQRDQARASGVHAIGGVTGGSVPVGDYKDLSAEQAVPVLAQLFGYKR